MSFILASVARPKETDEPVERLVPVAGTGGGKGLYDGVSLHSHTNQSKETLDFISELSKDWSVLQPVMRWAERRCKRLTGIDPDYARSYWTPPLTPSLAFDLERRQIEEKLQLHGLVSITDHDDIQAPMLLRTVAASRHIPVSVEWTVPFGETAFHLGIHNLPSAHGSRVDGAAGSVYGDAGGDARAEAADGDAGGARRASGSADRLQPSACGTCTGWARRSMTCW